MPRTGMREEETDRDELKGGGDSGRGNGDLGEGSDGKWQCLTFFCDIV